MARVEIKVPDWVDRVCAWPVMVYRKRRYGWPFRKIDLGEGEFTIVEPPDYYRLKNFKWYLSGNGADYYARRNVKISHRKTKIVGMHREIMNAPAEMLVDHKNGNALDNRRANLRLATSSQNNCNRRINKSKSYSQFRGVCFERRRRILYAKIKVHGKSIYLGSFDNEIDAAKAYDAAAKKYFGEFARLNFPEEAAVS
jgi:hypothetical protein